MQTAVPLSSTPAAGQLVEHDGKTYETVREGRAYILIPPNTRTSVDPQAKAKKAEDGSAVPQDVFYNPIQQFNRDLSVLAIKVFGEDLCEEKRTKHELKRPNHEAKKERKRKRKDGLSDGAEEPDGGVKLQKGDDGSPLIAAPHTLAGLGGEQLESEIIGQSVTAEGEDASGRVIVNASSGERPRNGDKLNTSKAEDQINGVHSEQSIEPQVGSGTQEWRPSFRILDALSATGLRALRYAAEIPSATEITAVDMDKKATNSIKLNILHNKLSATITAKTDNAIGFMYHTAFPPTDSHGPHHLNGRYDAVDLDPYGTAVPFIDAALQALDDDGLLCVTCTDSGVLASCGYSEKTFSLYGGLPIKGHHSHEGGLRLVLQSVASTAAKYGLAIEPMLSLSIDFYVRLFIRVRKSPAEVKLLAGKSMLVYGCDHGCGAWTTQMLGRNIRLSDSKGGGGGQHLFKHSIAQAPNAHPICDHCGSKTHVAGPMWGGPIHNAAFIERILGDLESADEDVYQTKPRIEGMLTTALDELSVIPGGGRIWQETKRGRDPLPRMRPETMDLHPFFFLPSALAKVIHCQAPSEAALKGALRSAGYIATRSHCKPGSIKTDAPWDFIWEVMREWVRQKAPTKEGGLKEGFAGWTIMQNARKQDDESGDAADSGENGEHAADGAIERNVAVPSVKQRGPERIKVVFDEVLGKDKPGKRLVRYQQNPREHWGPMSKAKGSVS